MRFSQIIRYPFYLLGFKSKKRQEPLPPDMEADAGFREIYRIVRPYSMVDLERSYALYQSVNYILNNKIPGDLVECGVWKGGSCMLIAYTLLQAGVTDRTIWLYDTFTGMARPGVNDGGKELKEWEEKKVNDDQNDWCFAPLAEVEANMRRTGYPFSKLRFIKGKVEETIPGTVPGRISLLRLDTDWYDSTKHELLHLYPLLEKGGVLIIDDYGVWQGARKATDEYFNDSVYLHRVDWSARLVIK